MLGFFPHLPMEELYSCVDCAQLFKVVSSHGRPVHPQHEVEMKVECPYCFKVNAIVWPLDDSSPLVADADGQLLQCRNSIRLQILRVARQLISGEVRVIEGARELSTLCHEAQPQLAALLLIFTAIASETDALPVGDVRKEWSSKALKHKDHEIADAEEFYREAAIKAAAELVRLLEHPS